MTDHRPWFRSYPEGVPKTLDPYPEKSLFTVLEDSARRFPDRPAIAWFGRHITYKELLRETERFSAALAGLGVKQGDRVALILPNCPQYVIAYYATVRIGGVIVGNNPLYTARELAHQLNDCGAEVVLVLDSLWPNLKNIEGGYRPRETVVTGVPASSSFPVQVLPPLKPQRRARKQAATRP